MKRPHLLLKLIHVVEQDHLKHIKKQKKVNHFFYNVMLTLEKLNMLCSTHLSGLPQNQNMFFSFDKF